MTLLTLVKIKKKIPFIAAIKPVGKRWRKVKIIEYVRGSLYPFKDSDGFLYRGSAKALGLVEGGKHDSDANNPSNLHRDLHKYRRPPDDKA